MADAPSWTTQQVLGLAPDESGARAARGLATPRPWSGTGQSDRALWGECKGSGKTPYSVDVDLSEPAFRCTCPSRKFPCKHSLALMLLWSSDPGALPHGAPPERVAEWIASRDERSQRSEERSERRAESAPDPEAQAKRAEQRAERVRAGVDELRVWLSDLIRQGLADARARPYGFWDEAAARMVDSQAPALASRLRRMGGLAAGPDGWEERLLAEAGLLHLLIEAHGRADQLPEPLREDVSTLIGRPQQQEVALESGERVRDEWAVIGRFVSEDERLKVQRTWLWGTETGRGALIMAFAPTGGTLDTTLVVGTSFDGEVAFFPSAHPLRGVVADRHGATEQLAAAPGWPTVAAAYDARADGLARLPWIDRLPASLTDVTPVSDGGRWWLVDEEGDGLELRGPSHRHWQLAALSGGAAIGVAGEWEGDALAPLSASADARVVAL